MLKVKRSGKPLTDKRLFHAAEIDICMPFFTKKFRIFAVCTYRYQKRRYNSYPL